MLNEIELEQNMEDQDVVDDGSSEKELVGGKEAGRNEWFKIITQPEVALLLLSFLSSSVLHHLPLVSFSPLF